MKAIAKLPLIMIGAISFSLLFCFREPGFNYLLFYALALALWPFSGLDSAKRTRLAPFMALALLYAAPVFLYGSEPMMPLFWVIWIMGAVTVAFGWKVAPLALGTGIASHILSPFVLLSEMIRDRMPRAAQSARQTVLYLVAGTVFLAFTVVYAGASTMLSSSLENLFVFDLPDVLSYLFWAGVGLVVFGTLLHPYLPPMLVSLDHGLRDKIDPEGESSVSKLLKITQEEEFKPALILMIALTCLATFAALGDAWYLLQPNRLPDGVTYTEFVHKSVGVIVLGVLLVAALAGAMFRDGAHHQPRFAKVRSMFYLFLIANLLLVIVAWAKNMVYIDAYSLTFKRIGVYVWLALVAGGLILTAIKLAGMRSFYWLAKSGLWAGIAAFGVYCVMPTDRMVRNAQLADPSKTDLKYLMQNLSHEEAYYLALEVPDRVLEQAKDIKLFTDLNTADPKLRRQAMVKAYAEYLDVDKSWLSDNLAHMTALREARERKVKGEK